MLSIEWAENEIKLAKEEAGEYSKDMLDSALMAYVKLFKEGHTGYSFGKTTEIVQRLLEKKPLTAIKDLPEEWTKAYKGENHTDYVSKRRPSLIKTVRNNGPDLYDDIDRVVCVDISTGDATRLRLGREVVNTLFPIEMPYYPPLGYFKVYYEELFEPDGILFKYLIKPDGEKVILNWSYTYDKARYELEENKNE